MNLWYWPFALGSDTQLSYIPGGGVVENLHRFFLYTVTTSSFGWDTGPRHHQRRRDRRARARPCSRSSAAPPGRAAFDGAGQFR